MNASQKRLFEEARKKNPDLKMPAEKKAPSEFTEADLALIKQGVGDKTSRPQSAGGASGSDASEEPAEQFGAIITYFEEKGFGFLRPENGGRDIFFHISRVVEAQATDLTPGTRVAYELGMDRTGKMAASMVKLAPPAPAAPVAPAVS
ncbi:cold shock domain-containing protein [Nevskia soli]|uniref:cold shock domain-containing protein n=1 Tax=Nevskia soli TaxID=418856 RepID=UPI001C5CAEFB|nr:cold shock domain-containing protein [Nevskia soli]